MKFIQDGWHWLEVDTSGHVVGAVTNAQHAILVRQQLAEYAGQWAYHFANHDWLYILHSAIGN